MRRFAGLSLPEYESVLRLVNERTGLTFSANVQQMVRARLRTAWSQCGCPDLDEYLAAISSGGRAFDTLIAELTVGETYFFREPAQFDFIRSDVLPDLRPRCRSGRGARVWSAGCASGEEAYSLAILLREAGLKDELMVLGSDISRQRLERARDARYSRWSLRGVPEHVVERYFSRRGNRYRLLPEVREAVKFLSLNLAHDPYPSIQCGVWGMDIVVCRNVLIYLDPAAVEIVARRLIESLAPTGWLFLGASDPMLNNLIPCEAVSTPCGIAYRRATAPTTIYSTAPGSSRHSPPTGLIGNGRAPSSAPKVDTSTLAGVAVPSSAKLDSPSTRQEVLGSSVTPSDDAAGEWTLEEWVSHARTLADEGRLEEAHRACLTALAQHPASAPLLYLKALLCSASGRFDDAAAAARAALYVDNDLVVGHLVLGQARLALKDRRGASRALLHAARLLARMPADDVVPAAGGQPAGTLKKLVDTQLKLLGEAA